MGCKRFLSGNSTILILILLLLSIVYRTQEVELGADEACTVSSVENRPFDGSWVRLSTEPTNPVNLKILKCFNVSLATLNEHYLADPNVFYMEIKLEAIGASGGHHHIKFINTNQTEVLQIIDSHLSDMQLMQIFSSSSSPPSSVPSSNLLNSAAKHNNNNHNNFVNLIKLDVSGNQLTKINRELLKKSTRLRVLNLSKNSITEISDGAFDDLQELSELYLNNNHLLELTGGPLFGHLRQLSILDLSNNTISDLPRHAFNGLTRLIKLNLASNKLHVIPFQVFKELRSIEILDLSHNMLVLFLDNFFVLNKKLKILNLHHNIIEKIAKNSLYGLKELHTLDMSGNQLILVDRNAFDTLEELKYLNLANNRIYMLSPSVFLALKRLKSIDLSNNVFKSLPLGVFANQYDLEEITMENTHLEMVSNWITKTATNATINKNVLKNLKYLSLRNNSKLKEIESCVFQNMPNVERMFLNHNNLTFLPKEIGEMRKLQELDVSNNSLQFIPVGIKDLVNLRVFNLMDNDLYCDCRMYWILNWIDELKAKNQTLPYDLLRLSELKCRMGYPGDVIKVLQHMNCVKPYLFHKSESVEHLLNTVAVLECSFAGNPAPEIVWRTPHGEILRYNEHAEPNPNAKMQLHQHHDSIGDPFSEKKYEELPNPQMLRSKGKYEEKAVEESTPEQLRTGPGITLLENGSLKIVNISRKDAGLYTCFAVNIMGNSTSDVRLVITLFYLENCKKNYCI